MKENRLEGDTHEAVGFSDLLALLHIQPRKGGHIVIEGNPDDEEEYLHMSEVKKIIKHLSSRDVTETDFGNMPHPPRH